VSFASAPSHGEKNGNRFGIKSNIAQRLAENDAKKKQAEF